VWSGFAFGIPRKQEDRSFPGMAKSYTHGLSRQTWRGNRVPDVGRFGLSICYDICFPETTLPSAGVQVLIHPVRTGTTDRVAEIAIVPGNRRDVSMFCGRCERARRGVSAAPSLPILRVALSIRPVRRPRFPHDGRFRASCGRHAPAAPTGLDKG
jgi:hypothetical protein